MNILVTGACGFIGSHLVEKLVKENHNVRAFTFYNSRNSHGWLDNVDKKILKDLNLISGDIRDYNFLHQHTKKIDVIIHLAALIGIPYSYHAVKSYIDTNITGTYNVLNSAKINNVSKTIITSTSEVYGTAQRIPILENHPLNAQSPYAASKIAADQLALSFYKSYGLPLTIMRPFNTFGPRQSARAIIPTIITQLLQRKNIIKLGNLTPTRDFTYIDDTVNAFLNAIKAKKISGEVINIGNKFEISIKDILKIINKDFGYHFGVKIDKKRIRSKSSEVYRLYAYNAKAVKILKWRPKYSGLKGFKKALQKTINWFSDPKNLKYYNSDIYNI
jgi:dTDP-glucose 4,6-dehydratase